MDWKSLPVRGQIQYRDPLQEARQQYAQQQQKPQDNGNFFTSLIPTGGGIAGTAAGAGIGTAIAPGIGTLIGALLGGAVGGGGGKVVENAVENKDLFQGVPQEAALSGVLGAGPLRLGKAAIDVGRGLKAGTGLADAVANAGTNAVQGSIRGAVGNKLTNASNDMVVKNFRLTPSQLNNFQNKFGEDASQVIKRYGLVGKDASTITENAIKPLQGEFDNIASQVPTVPTADVLKAFKAKYNPLVNSAVEDNKVIGQQLQQQADTIAKKYGAEIPATELNKLRQEFDSLVSYADKAANPARYGVNKRSADALRSVMQTAADNAGLKASNGMTFKEVGQELSKLHQLTDNIGKQEQLGRGSNPLGLGTLLGGGIGSTGGVPGAIAGAAAVKVANSAPAKTLLAKGFEKTGQRLTDKAASAQPFSIGGATKRIAPIGLTNAYLSNLSNTPAADNTQTTTSPMTANTNNMGTSYNTSQGMSSMQGTKSPYSQANLMADIQRDPKNADKYVAYYSAMQKAFTPPSAKPLNATQLQQANNAQSGLTALGTIQDLIQKDPNALLKAAVPTDIGKNLVGGGVLETARREASDVISRLRTGAAINKEEESFYRSQLPQLGDSADTINYKLNLLGTLFSRFANPEAAQPDASSGSDLLTALMSAQGQ